MLETTLLATFSFELAPFRHGLLEVAAVGVLGAGVLYIRRSMGHFLACLTGCMAGYAVSYLLAVWLGLLEPRAAILPAEIAGCVAGIMAAQGD